MDTIVASTKLVRFHRKATLNQTILNGSLQKKFQSKRLNLLTISQLQMIANKEKSVIAGSFLHFPFLLREMNCFVEVEMAWIFIQK
jgi:hypothetical protein